MPQRTLSEEEFTTIKQSLLRAAPDGLDEANFQRWFQPRFDGAIAEAEHSPAPVTGRTAGRFLRNAGAMLNPITAVRGLAQAAAHPLETYDALVDASADQFTKAGQAWDEGRYSELIGHGAAGALPILGPAAAAAGEQLAEGDVAGGLGTAAGLGIGTVAAGPLARGVGRAVRPVTSRAGEYLYQSALKPTKAVLKGVRTAADAGPDAARQTLVRTGLREGIPVSGRGAKKAETLVDSLNAEVDARLAAADARGATLDPAYVERQIREVAADFTDQVNAQPDLAAIETVRQNFRTNPHVEQPILPVEAEAAALQRHLRGGREASAFRAPEPAMAPGPIPIRTGQRMKQNTYRGLRGKYGQERTATIEAEKAGARGLKEQIETQAPEVAGLNARESTLIPLEEALADAMRRRGNYSIFGLTPVVAAGQTALSGNAWPLLAALVDRMPGVVSRGGIWMNRAGRTGRGAQRAARASVVATSPSESQRRTTEQAWPVPLTAQ